MKSAERWTMLRHRKYITWLLINTVLNLGLLAASFYTAYRMSVRLDFTWGPFFLGYWSAKILAWADARYVKESVAMFGAFKEEEK